MVSQRQLAERQRVEGNALYAQGQHTAAFQCYETGLEAERHNMALHNNAAQVLVKMGCYVQAIEHCDKVSVMLAMLALQAMQLLPHPILISLPCIGEKCCLR